jgi:hypothetical protein
MSGDASKWYTLLERNHDQPSWPDFIKLVNRRFGPLLCSNPLGELIQIHRETTLVEYQSKFLALLARCDDLVEKHQIYIFTAGLGNPLRTDMELKHPTTLDNAMALARIYEQRLALTGDSSACTYMVRSSPYWPPFKPLLFTVSSATSGTSTTPLAPCFKCLTTAEMAAKRERGECFHCTEKYSHAHVEVCQPKGVFLLQMDDESTSIDADTEEDPRVSLHAITGLSSTETMQLEVRLNDHTIDALVDSGSTHSFISVTGACRLHLDPVHKPGLHVGVANGDQVVCTGICRVVHIFIYSEEFVIDLFVIPLEGYDMVLGVQWLRTLGLILWDLAHTHMNFWHDDHRIVWQGTTWVATSVAAHAMAATDLMAAFLRDFDNVFATPTGLPPPRRHNHHIHLIPETAPVAVRPYRYPQLVKDELEQQCQDMLQQCIIRPSTSAFSSPVLLVKKNNGTWHFCVDYCALNAKTVRDMFPIPSWMNSSTNFVAHDSSPNWT